MAYNKKDWVDGEVITEQALDNLENGVVANEAKNTQQDAEVAALKQKDAAIEAKVTALEKKVVNASASVDGLMTKVDKAKLDGIAANANNYTLPAANKTTFGGVKQAAAVQLVAAANAENVSGTSADPGINKIVALANDNKSKLNALISALKAAGVIANA